MVDGRAGETARDSMGLLFLCGAALVAVSVLLPGQTAPTAAIALAAIAAVIGIALLRTERAVPGFVLQSVCATGTALISAVVLLGETATTPKTLLYVWVGLYSGAFFRPAKQAGQVAFVGVAFGVTLVALPGDVGPTTPEGFQSLLFVVGAVGVATVWVSLLRRLIDRMAAAEQRQAVRDPLTGLANRAALFDAGRDPRSNARRAMLLIDIDDFKAVNDGLGHAGGDLLLREAAARMASLAADADVVTRLGGDEFAILVEHGGRAGVFAQRLVHTLQQPYEIDADLIEVTVSIGVATAGGPTTIEELLGNADLALFASKDSPSGWSRFEPAMRTAANTRRTLVRDLQAAIDEGQLSLRYQPIIGLTSGRTLAMEALVRWEHPEQGTVGPDRFIPVAESTGLIVPLGQYVLRAACEEAATWKGPDAPVVSVNLSPRQLLDDRLISDVRDALAEHGLPPRRLVLEVTETSVMTDPDMALRRLRELRALGVGIAIDDFGTGYSSLEYLRTLPATTVKLARPFVMDLAGDPANAALASGIIDLAHALGLLVVAEGIEEIEQQLALLSMGCDLAQGYLFDRPLTAADARARLQPETTQFTDSTRFTESETPSAGGAARAARA